jgi:hypothetical protein
MADRTFKVILECKAKGKAKPKILSLPCSGELPYSGCDALEVMREYKTKRPGVKTSALTQNRMLVEELTMDEMEELYGEETAARKPWEHHH